MGRFNFNQEEFEKVKDNAEKLYETFDMAYCPYFKEKISFNAKGLRHLKFKSDQQARSNKDQYARLKLLYLAPQILNKSHTLQGIWQTKQFEQFWSVIPYWNIDRAGSRRILHSGNPDAD